MPRKVVIIEYVEETKNKRMQLVVRPSLYKALKQKALSEDRSMNDIVHKAIEKALEE